MNTIKLTLPKTDTLQIDSASYIKAVKTLTQGELILVGGNGGSFADGQHFVAELTGRFEGDTNVFPAMSMVSNSAELTAFANDYGYKNIFNPIITGFRKFNPSFLFISTSGTSENIVTGINKILTDYDNRYIVLLTGGNDTEFEYNSDVVVIHVPSLNTQIIQNWHSIILHSFATDIKKSIKS